MTSRQKIQNEAFRFLFPAAFNKGCPEKVMAGWDDSRPAIALMCNFQ